MTKRYIGKRIVRFLAEHGAFPGFTLGDICEALRLHPGTAAHQRITEARRKGFDIRCHKDGDHWRYWLPYKQRQAVLKESK